MSAFWQGFEICGVLFIVAFRCIVVRAGAQRALTSDQLDPTEHRFCRTRPPQSRQSRLAQLFYSSSSCEG